VSDAHVIGHDIEHLTQMMLSERVAELFVADCAAELGVDALMVKAIVAVCAARGGLKIWRAVNMADAQRFKIVGDFSGFLETKPRTQLEAVGGSGGVV
jgi:hypothetical protein